MFALLSQPCDQWVVLCWRLIVDIEPTKFLGLDVRAAPLIASFFGAMAYAIVLRVKSPGQMISIVLVGLGVAAFLGPLIVAALRSWGFAGVADDGLQNASGFIAGIGGMAICNGLIAVSGKLGTRNKTDESN